MPKRNLPILSAALILVLLLAAFIPLLNAAVIPENDVRIFMDGQQIIFPDQQPFIDQNNRTMVPARYFSEAMGLQVDWDAARQQVTLSRGSSAHFSFDSMTLTIGESDVIISPDRHEKMDTTAILVNDRLMLPLRFISSYLNCPVTWDTKNRTVHIFSLGQSEEEQARLISTASAALTALPRVNSAERLQELLDQSRLKNGYFRNDYNFMLVEDAEESLQADGAMPAPAEKSISGSYSDTNVQVQGVDEADIVKCDGEYIYQVKDHEVIIIKAKPASSLAVTARINLEENPRELYINDSQLIIISDSYDYGLYPIPMEELSQVPAGKRLMPSYYHQPGLMINTYDIANQNKPVKVNSYRMEGSYLSSRMIGHNVFIITNQSLYEPVKPVYYVNDSPVEIPYTQIKYFPDILHDSYLNIARLTTDGKNQFTVDTYLGSGSEIYCSNDHLYVTAVEYNPAYNYEYSMPSESTLVFKFNLGPAVEYQAKGIVPGRLLNQFSMDEYNHYFRLFTTTDEWSSESSSALYILDSNLKKVSQILNIAPGEKIYSARFMEDRAYLVTFKQMDPFFVLDLNPQNPTILGKLKIPGFSSYLHPYRDDYVIGLGYDTVATKGGGVRQGGIKAALFNVHDVNNPLEVDQAIIGTSGSSSEACDNHKAFLLYNNLLAFPCTVYESASSDAYYGSFSFQGAYVYGISEAGLDYRGRITHLNNEDYLKAGDSWYNSEDNVRRIIYLDDKLYTLSDDRVMVHDSFSLQEIRSISTAD